MKIKLLHEYTLVFILPRSGFVQQHAQAEFRLKQFQLDIERASWLVETALDWDAKQDKELPNELLAGLSRNLFNFEDEKIDQVRHPVDELASALMGTASKVKLNLAGNQVEPFRSLGWWSHFFMVIMSFGNCIQRWKRIGLNHLSWLQMELQKLTRRFFTYAINSLHSHKSSSFSAGFDSNKHWFLTGSTSTTFARSLSPNIGVIKLDALGQPVDTISVCHCLAYFSQHVSGGRPRHFNMLRKSQGRHASFVRCPEVNSPEPFHQWNFGGMKQGVSGNRNLMSIIRTLIELSRRNEAEFLSAVHRALKSIWPTDLGKSLRIGFFCAKSFLPLNERY
nr:hypothetical protein [uncultured Desulfobulbus sp.]